MIQFFVECIKSMPEAAIASFGTVVVVSLVLHIRDRLAVKAAIRMGYGYIPSRRPNKLR